MANTYTRNGRPMDPSPAEMMGPPSSPEEGAIRVNGFAQVLSLLQAADPAFRESLLRRLAQRDPRLVRQLRAELAELGY